MLICLKSNIRGQYLLDLLVREYNKFVLIKGQSLYPDKGNSGGGGWCF